VEINLGQVGATWIDGTKSNNMQPDQITLQRIEAIHPKLRNELRQIYKEICEALSGKLGCRFVQVFRSFAEQDALYAQGRTKPGQKVTDAKGGQSYHNYGLAIDFCLLHDKNVNGQITSDEIIWDRSTDIDNDHIIDWIEVVRIFQKYGWTWGAAWKDFPHFEKSFGYKTSQLLKKYNAGEFISGTKYLNSI
jgi:peptidoglycan LD-endopeptidase CwlK